MTMADQSGSGSITSHSHSESAQATSSNAASEPRQPPNPSLARDEGDEDEEDDEEPSFDLPITHEAVMKDHHKTVSALSVDPAGARVCTGGYDYECKLWDFGGMNASFRPFRSWEPVSEGSYQVNSVAWSETGDRILIASATNQAKMYSRDGEYLVTYPKGDMYIRDLKNTAGHVAEITQAIWHTRDDNLFLTASNDSTVRIWDAGKLDKSKSVIVVKSKERGQRTHITSLAMSHDGKWVAAAGLDGCINVWGMSSNFVRPNYTAEKAHEKNTIISGLAFSLDNYTIVSRGNDNTVKLWDMRKMKQPLLVRDGLPNENQETNVIFSPDENLIVTGTAGRAHMVGDKIVEAPDHAGSKRDGQLVFMKRSDLSIVKTVNVSAGNVVRVEWNAKINQIFASTSLGAVHIYYDPEQSTKGATMCVQRAVRRKAIDEGNDTLPSLDQIVTPDALPLFRDPNMDLLLGRRTEKRGVNSITGEREKSEFKGSKRLKTSDRHDPKKTMKPEPPVEGPGRGGRIGASATQHVVQGLAFNRTRDEDPRAALLKYAETTSKDPQWTAAWQKTQPKTVFDDTPYEEEFDEDGRSLADKQKKRKAPL